jgi:hypothetical protein
MSYSGAIPLDPDHSDSAILIDACLARIRRDAGTNEPVLPPMRALLRAETRSAAPATRARVPNAQAAPLAIGSEESLKLPRSEVSTAKRSRRAALTPRVGSEGSARSEAPRKRVSRVRWPVILCGFIGVVFAGAALMKSPLGHRPEVQHVVKGAQQYVEGAYAAVAVAAKARLNR